MPVADPEQPATGMATAAANVATPANPAGRLAGRTTARTVIRWTVLATLAGFAGWAVAGNWGGLSAAVGGLAPWAVPVAFLPAALAMLVGLLVWRTLLADLGHRLPGRVAARIFFVSQLGKYVPGSVWSILTQMELSREHGVPRRANLTAGVLTIAVSVTTALLVAAVLLPLAAVPLPLADASTAGGSWVLLPAIVVLLAVLQPAILGRCVNLLLRLARRPPLRRNPSAGGLGRAAALQVLVWWLLGLQAWVLLVGAGAPSGHALLVAVGGYALAYGLGQLAVGLPAGAGVREAALTLSLATVVPTATALAIALLARAVLTTVDLAMAGGQLLAVAARRRPPASG